LLTRLVLFVIIQSSNPSSKLGTFRDRVRIQLRYSIEIMASRRMQTKSAEELGAVAHHTTEGRPRI